MEFNEEIKLPFGEIVKNTYTFVLRDENGKEVDRQVVNNISMAKRYYLGNVTNLTIAFSSMLPNDYKKYQDNGVWKEGWAAHGEKGGAVSTSGEVMDVNKKNADGTPYYQFKKKIDKEDTSLIGTTVLSSGLNWSCSSISRASVMLIGKCTFGYHSPDHYANQYNDSETVNRQGMKEIASTTFGIKVDDGGLFQSNGGMMSHFATSFIKRPATYLDVTATVLFKISFTDRYTFNPYGNYLCAHGRDRNSGTVQYIPTHVGISGYGQSYCENDETKLGGDIPIPAEYGFSLYKVTTDCPNDWDAEKEGPWRGFPVYYYYGEGYLYKQKKIRVKTGEVDENGEPVYEEKIVDDLNSRGQRQFNWANLKEKKFITNGPAYGPVRSIVFAGYGRRGVPSGAFFTGTWNGIKIGEGDGSSTRFYTPFSSEIATVTSGYAITANGNVGAQVTEYVHKTPPFGVLMDIRDDDGVIICTADQRGKIIEGLNYSSDSKGCHFALNPFDLNYYPVSGEIAGVYNWLVYDSGNMNGVGGHTIMSSWIGDGWSYGWLRGSSDITIRTADNIRDLFRDSHYYRRLVLDGGGAETLNINFQLDRYVAIKLGSRWSEADGNCMVGNMRYKTFDKAAIRISEDNDPTGHIDFVNPPPIGAPIYIDANIITPFLWRGDQASAKICLKCGDEGFNGYEGKGGNAL